jgi:MoaA/NifB/PqqE/SkfB family radical SAM enzyme
VRRIVVELTNRCNLRCGHCFEYRHAATSELSLDIIDILVRDGKDCGIEQLSFTGGEPTLHHAFSEIVRRTCQGGYTFGFVSNGSTLPHIYPLLLRHRQSFNGVTFSLDGAREETHDRLRGKGSYRDVMSAASVCVFHNLPFTFNMVLTSQNRNEVQEMIQLGRRLGSRAVRFGHLMPTPDTARRELDMTPEERHETETEIWKLKERSKLPIGMAPGYYHETPFFPCGPLVSEESNLDCHGNLTLCCHLSGYSGSRPDSDVVANLRDTSLAEAFARLQKRVAVYLTDKQERVRSGEFTDLDHFPCWYCVKYLGKTDHLRSMSGHNWISRDKVTVEHS